MELKVTVMVGMNDDLSPKYRDRYVYLNTIAQAEEFSPTHTKVFLMPSEEEILINEPLDKFKKRVDNLYDRYEEEERARQRRDDLGI